MLQIDRSIQRAQSLSHEREATPIGGYLPAQMIVFVTQGEGAGSHGHSRGGDPSPQAPGG
jgi:hypothetical protein